LFFCGCDVSAYSTTSIDLPASSLSLTSMF
jgi:hypothetical protein